MRQVMLITFVLLASEARAELDVRCTQGCLDAGGNRTFQLLLRKDLDSSVTIEWSAHEDPNTLGRIVTLHAGNPHTLGDLRKRRQLRFRKVEGRFVESETFTGADLQSGTFITAVTARPGREPEKADLSNEEIIDWRPFRLLTETERVARELPPPPATRYALDVVPMLLQAESGHGPLPRADGGDRRAWWSTVSADGVFGDLDLDGESTGIPGLGVQVSTPWETRGDNPSLKDKVLSLGTGMEGHQVRFEEMKWWEVPNRTEHTGRRDLEVKHFYTMVTLYTRASVTTFKSSDVIRPRPLPLMDETHFAHETSARIRHSEDPRLWASYSKREYGQDERFLRLLSKRGRIPGLAGVQTDDGDGGSATYAVGFHVRVKPWDQLEGSGWTAGLVGVDVVAARRGIGGLKADGAATTAVGRAWCEVVGCEDGNGSIDLRKAPAGYTLHDSFSALGTLSGNVQLLESNPSYAERLPLGPKSKDARTMSDAGTGLTGFPDSGRFALSAVLRAGALTQDASFWRVDNLLPIDVYAQYVVRFTVVASKGTEIHANPHPNGPKSDETGGASNTHDNDPLRWVRDHQLALAVAGTGVVGVGLVVLCAVNPAFLMIVQRIIAALGKLFFSIVKAFTPKKKQDEP